MDTNSLNRIIYGRNPTVKDGGEHLIAVAMSGNLTSDDANLWRGLITLDPPSTAIKQDAWTVGLFNGPDRHFILAQAAYGNADPTRPVYQLTLLPRPYFLQSAANIQAIINQAKAAFPTDFPPPKPLAPIEATRIETTIDQKSFFQAICDQHETTDIPLLLVLLDAALSDKKVLVCNFSQTTTDQIALVQALMLLLPPPARGAMTFTLRANQNESTHSRIVFGNETTVTTRHIIDLKRLETIHSYVLQSPYIENLMQLWQEKTLDDFIAALDTLAANAKDMSLENGRLLDGLAAITERYQLDLAVLSDADVPIEQLMAVLTTRPPVPGDLLTGYVQRLLQYTLQERDQESALLVAQYMDENAALRERLNSYLMETLQSEPDAVYFFIRTHLKESFNPEWLPTLQQAATVSLQVAAESGDNGILLDWLELIAREPDSYQLETVLYDSIQQAQQRTHEDGDLGQQLLIFVCKRIPTLIDTLLNDAALMAKIAAPTGPALRDYDPAAVSEMFTLGWEISLVLLARASQDAAENSAAANVFLPSYIDRLWALGPGDEPAPNLPEAYSPEFIIEKLVTEGVDWLPHESLQILLSYMVSIQDVAHLQQIAPRLAEGEQLASMLVIAVQNSEIPAETTIHLLTELAIDSLLNPQKVSNIYLRLIEHYNWQRDAVQPLVEQLTRLLQQYQEVVIAIDILWEMLRIAREGDLDIINRAITRRILVYVGTVEDDTRLVDMMTRLHQEQKKDSTSRRVLFSWWRQFAHEHSHARLRAITKQLEERKELEEVRAILKTSHSIKHAIGSSNLSNFAEAINVAFTILQTLSDSFDPVNRPESDFDRLTVEAELEARKEELSGDEQRVLAKNLRELAQLVATMADYRSKPSMLRREEDIDRQLLNGEQSPHSAIDMMKWLSGYIDGTQTDTKGE